MKKSNNNSDFRFGPFNIPNENDFVEISENVKKALSGENQESKKQKTTYSISPLATTLIKDFAEECGVTQGGIVELAPLLFRILASESLNRRQSELSSIKILIDQIINNLNTIESIAPQLKCYSDFIKKATEELFILESNAVKDKNYKGVDTSATEILSQVKNKKPVIAFHKDVEKILSKDENIESLFKTMK